MWCYNAENMPLVYKTKFENQNTNENNKKQEKKEEVKEEVKEEEDDEEEDEFKKEEHCKCFHGCERKTIYDACICCDENRCVCEPGDWPW